MSSAIFAVFVFLLMMAGCFLISGSSIVAGSIFEKKTSVGKKNQTVAARQK